MHRKKLSGWLYVPLVALLGLVLYHPVKQMSLTNSIAETKTLANVPLETFQELLDEHKTQSYDRIAVHLPPDAQRYLPKVNAALQRREDTSLVNL